MIRLLYIEKPLLTEHKTCSLKGDGMSIEIGTRIQFPGGIRELLTEYTDMLIEGDSDIKNYLELQNYDEELEDLQTKYGLPYGRLYLAYSDKSLPGVLG